MKVKDAIEQLKNLDPNAELGFCQYVGCDSPFFTRIKFQAIPKGAKVSNHPYYIHDGGNYIKDDKAMKDLVLICQ